MADNTKKADNHLMNPMGGINQSIIKTTDNVAFITISINKETSGGSTLSDSASSKWSRVQLAMAPVTGVDIQQMTDYSITKSLDKDFLIATFGDTPVQITLRGVNFFNLGDCYKGNAYRYISDFYDDNKLSSNKNIRFDVAIASSKSNAVAFRCVLVGLSLANDTTTHAGQIMASYTLSFIGVRKNPQSKAKKMQVAK